jgi:plasmid stability protein
MGVLNIRNLPDDVHARLRVRAAEAGRSMEAEAREIIAAACRPEGHRAFDADALQDYVTRLYAGRKPRRVVDRLIAERRREAARE